MQKAIVAALPAASLVVFYGSAVFSQGEASQQDSTKLLDLLVVADDPAEWHKENRARHPAHYPRLLCALGPARLGLIFFPYAEVAQMRCKYGIISTEAFIRDLEQWDSLYCAGRLQKPVKIVGQPTEAVQHALSANLTHALHASLQLLPSSFSEKDVYEGIARLSYDGDIRMLFAETPDKIQNLVKHNMDHFSQLYRPLLNPLVVDPSLSRLQLRPNCELLLPPRFDSNHLRKQLWTTVRRSSLVQTCKGPLSAGLYNSVRYGFRKILKRFK